MSDEMKHSWQALGEQMGELGSLMQQRFEAPATERTDMSAEGTTDQIKASLDQVVAATRELGERIGDVASDDDVRATATETMTSLDAALRSTVDFITQQIEGVVKPSNRDDA